MKDTHSRHTAQRASHFCTIKLRTVHTNPHLDKEVNAEQCDQPQIDGSERTEGGQVAALGRGGGQRGGALGGGGNTIWGVEELRAVCGGMRNIAMQQLQQSGEGKREGGEPARGGGIKHANGLGGCHAAAMPLLRLTH